MIRSLTDLRSIGPDFADTYRLGGRKLAMAVVHRDLEGLRAEVEFEKAIAANGGMVTARTGPAVARVGSTSC
jgi:hypothetical protein